MGGFTAAILIPKIQLTFQQNRNGVLVTGDSSFALVSSNNCNDNPLWYGPSFGWCARGSKKADALVADRSLFDLHSLSITAMNRIVSGSDGTKENRHKHGAVSQVHDGESGSDKRQNTVAAIFSVKDCDGAISAATHILQMLTIDEMSVLRSLQYASTSSPQKTTLSWWNGMFPPFFR